MALAEAFPPELTVDGRIVPLEVHRHPRARHLKLTADPSRQQIRLTLPRRCALKVAQEFLTSRYDWIARQAACWPQPVMLRDGSRAEILGRPYTLCWQDSLRGVVTTRDDIIYVPGMAEGKGRRLEAFLDTQLLEFLTGAVGEYATTLHVQIHAITCKKLRSRWGSCSSDGELVFNSRLVFAPEEVVRYVAAHEVAHRVHMDHSRDFWQVVTALYPGHPTARRWLKRHGDGLYRYRL